jgi:hypothetical protein
MSSRASLAGGRCALSDLHDMPLRAQQALQREVQPPCSPCCDVVPCELPCAAPILHQLRPSAIGSTTKKMRVKRSARRWRSTNASYPCFGSKVFLGSSSVAARGSHHIDKVAPPKGLPNRFHDIYSRNLYFYLPWADVRGSDRILQRIPALSSVGEAVGANAEVLAS